MPLSNDAVQQLHDSLARPESQPWIWSEHGDEVIGVALRKERRDTKHGETDFLILEVDGNERSVLIGNHVLIGKLKGAHLQAGELVGIRRLGEKQPATPNGRPYIDFRVAVAGRENETLEWADTKALPDTTIDAEVIDDQYEIQHLPAEGVAF